VVLDKGLPDGNGISLIDEIKELCSFEKLFPHPNVAIESELLDAALVVVLGDILNSLTHHC
jgi:hypothetical protein